jgi:MinD superfamily P-loop ATPase
MCISCGNCSTYCEMGIDVRAYAQANTDVKRAACVGCGMCAHVCPRGVLKLEVEPVRWKAGQPIRVYAGLRGRPVSGRSFKSRRARPRKGWAS